MRRRAAAVAPVAWGTARALPSCLAPTANLWLAEKNVAFRSRTPMDWVDKLRASYLPVLTASRRSMPPASEPASDLLELVANFNRATDGTMVVDAAYLEVVITRR